MMPGMDGYQVAARIKGDPATRNIPVIMVTALDDREARLRGLSAGAEDFLTKPVDRTELCVRVRNLLRLKAYGDYHDQYSQMLEREVAVAHGRPASRARPGAALPGHGQRDADRARHRGRVTLANRFACTVLGLDRSGVARARLVRHLPRAAGAGPGEEDGSHDLLRGDLSTAENTIVTRSGDERLIEWRSTVTARRRRRGDRHVQLRHRRHRAASGGRGPAGGGRADAVRAEERQRRDLGHGLRRRDGALVRDPRIPVRPATGNIRRDHRRLHRAHSSRRSGVGARDARVPPPRSGGDFSVAEPLDPARRHGAVAERRSGCFTVEDGKVVRGVGISQDVTETQAGGGGTARGQGRRRGRQPGEERVPGQHEPRDPHADERRHRDDRSGARHRAHRRTAGEPADRQVVGRRAADRHQRHPRLLQDGGGQVRARPDRLQSARCDRRHGERAWRCGPTRRASN